MNRGRRSRVSDKREKWERAIKESWLYERRFWMIMGVIVLVYMVLLGLLMWHDWMSAKHIENVW